MPAVLSEAAIEQDMPIIQAQLPCYALPSFTAQNALI